MTVLTKISVVIPTYNRCAMLRDTLDSLREQTLSPEHFEVILVDDGSTDRTSGLASNTYPFRLQYIRQQNQGDAAARNLGARISEADFLVFLDDDILVDRGYLEALMAVHAEFSHAIVVGTEILWIEPENPLTAGPEQAAPVAMGEVAIELPFEQACSNNLSIRRNAYLQLGGMTALGFAGSSIWCDVEFSYRAHRQGYRFLRSPAAICWHRDYVAKSLTSKKKRMRETAYRAAALFRAHPGLLPHLPMFADKTPVRWTEDPPGRVLRKVTRSLASSPPALWVLEALARAARPIGPLAGLNRLLERWVIGGYLYRGLQDGIREFRPVLHGDPTAHASRAKESVSERHR